MGTTTLEIIRLGWPVSNVWLVPDTDIGPVLIDTGHPTTWPAIRAGLRRAGIDPRDLGAVLLTHRHSDHAGNAARIHQRYGVPIYAHDIDASVLREEAPRPRLRLRLDFASSLSMVENAFPSASVPSTRSLADGEHIAGFEVLWMPGHTRGSVFFYHAPSRALFTGDGLLCNPLPIERGALRPPVQTYCTSYREALDSLRAFAARDLPVDAVHAGHGPVRRSDVRRELAALLARIPAHG